MNVTEAIIKKGVESLKKHGYPNVDEENIFTDPIYSAFFKSMLEKNKGFHEDADKAINELLLRLK